MIAQIILVFQYISHLCNRFLIGVIRDFWTFSEISINRLDRFRKIHYISVILK